jgi:hypothetical protein
LSVEPSYEITPEPTEEEREAILQALAADNDRRPTSPWGDALLPARDGEEDEP